MGLCYDLLCPECGYKFMARFGRGGDDTPADEAEERFETRERNDEETRVYWAIREQKNSMPSVEYDSFPYHCRDCREFFHYDRIIIRGRSGIYRTDCKKCPMCSNPFVQQLDMNMLEGKETYGYGECEQKCPKCGHKLKVTGGGVYD